MPSVTGTVKCYLEDKGFGFIKPDSGGKDLFVHATAVKRAGLELLSEGDKISFEIEPNPTGKGPRAVNLAKVN